MNLEHTIVVSEVDCGDALVARLVEALGPDASSLKLQTAIERIEQERDATRLTIDDPSLTSYQRDLAAARCWAFCLALEILGEA